MVQENNTILTSLEAFLHEYGIPTKMASESGLTVLKARLNDLGRAEGEALMEICLLPLEPDASGAGRTLIQFYTTTAAGLDEANIAPALAALNAVNLRCPAGAFQIYTPLRQIYHKYTAVLLDGTDRQAQAQAALMLAVETVDRLFDETVVIADDAANAPAP